MSNWILQHFLNPAFFWPGMALLAAPILIHLINRLNYRRVRFAAMEFLLASQKRNRRRVLLEQLLLLLLRLALMLLVVALLARLIIDPEQLSLFQGARSHHLVILDDTASMRDRAGEGNVFETAKEVVRRIAAEGARRPGSQVLSLLLMSAPDKTVAGLSERIVDESLLAEITERLAGLECSYQSADPAMVLEAARQRLADDRSSVRHVHILSDFRAVNWLDNKGSVSALQSMDQAGMRLNLVRCIADAHENLGIVQLGGAVEVAAAGVPVTLSATVRNWGTREAADIRASVLIDGVRLPRTIDFQTIAPGQESVKTFDVVFDTAQPHQVRLTIGDDALEVDNQRFLAVDVPADNPVLIVDGSPGAEQAQYIADALAADKSITGFAPEIRSPEDLRRIPLDHYHLIYLINVPQLEPDAVAALEKEVRAGAGLIWYLGDAVNPVFYNDKLFSPAEGLFPARLGSAPVQIERSGSTAIGPSIAPAKHPLFSLMTGGEVSILDLVFINLMYPLAASEGDLAPLARDVNVVATLAGRPLMLEHKLGKGMVFTCLTAAGPLQNSDGLVWSNWANGPAGFSFVVLQLELAKRLIRKDRAFPQLETGTPIQMTFNQALYQPDVEVMNPDDQVTHLQAERDSQTVAEGDSVEMRTTFTETGRPGIYSLILTGQDQKQDRQLYAFNVPATEGSLAIADDAALFRELGEKTSITIQPAGNFDWIRSESPGSEIRWFLLVLLAIVCIAEQALAARLSSRSGPDVAG
ncbi:BatA domain-containing protein [Planctomicrobium sp. SH664]|uniref:BatA domain-containing protein n=1 Tax=Planctomicrobium sp. SH664 TaxID=3448125 RepID=UPI003F5BF4B2